MAADRVGKGANMNDLAINVSHLGDCVCGGRPNHDPRPFNDARLVECLGDPYLGTELLAALPWSGSGS